jgi:hypothetical protein
MDQARRRVAYKIRTLEHAVMRMCGPASYDDKKHDEGSKPGQCIPLQLEIGITEETTTNRTSAWAEY